VTTPIRQQYLDIKRQYPDCILLFRLGDFYEAFDEDAYLVSRELDITLTSREMGKGLRVPMAGIPYHALESYLGRLIRKGYRVAICEQLSDPATSRGLVERAVVRVVTPGTLLEPSLLDQKANNYIVAVVVQGHEAGLAYADISTGEFACTQLPLHLLPGEMERLAPAEVVVPRGAEAPPGAGNATLTPLDSHAFEEETARSLLLEHFGVRTLEPYGCEGLPLAVRSAGALLRYLQETQRGPLGQVVSLRTYSVSRYMLLDPQTRRNLELFQAGRFGEGGLSLFKVLDLTRTPMGARLLRRWLGQPLLDLGELLRRQEAVAWFHASVLRRERAFALLSRVGDLERLASRVRALVAGPRELLALKRALETVPQVRTLLEEDGEAVAWLRDALHPCPDLVDLIARAIREEPEGPVGQGGVIREGFSPELDELRWAVRNARDYIAGLEQRERERTGIPSLKVGYNKVFGYYIEVTRPNLSRVPADYIRKQTLTNAERFVTPELKEYEALVLNAEERIGELETALYRQVCRQVGEAMPRILATAEALAQVDVFCALAEVAVRHNYVRPLLNEGDTIDIRAGRHPVVERALPPGSFVPNDTYLSNRDCSLIILTGPNMSGKSTYIRQVALIVLLAQIGSFVPAESATIGLVDRIFTRVGLQDDLTVGQSTFMVEMVETAHILHHATPRSLVILDEVGRGTSTYDGMAIARAVAEYLHNHPRLGCKTLFATHYHELTRLAETLPRARNYHVAVVEEGDRIVFLHRVVPGGADRSYGVQVARLAGLPAPVVKRAMDLLKDLEADGRARPAGRRRREDGAEQLSLFGGLAEDLLRELLSLDLDGLTPIEALNRLYDLQRRAREVLG